MWQRSRLIGALALLLLGVAGLVVSFVLSPTPDTFMVMSNGHRVRTPATMHAVDYAIFILRIGGAVAALAGAYLAYRSGGPTASTTAAVFRSIRATRSPISRRTQAST